MYVRSPRTQAFRNRRTSTLARRKMGPSSGGAALCPAVHKRKTVTIIGVLSQGQVRDASLHRWGCITSSVGCISSSVHRWGCITSSFGCITSSLHHLDASLHQFIIGDASLHQLSVHQFISSSLRMHHFISWMFRDFHLVRAVLFDGSAKREVCDDVAALKTLVRLN